MKQERKIKNNPVLYRILRPVFTGLMHLIFRPRIIGKENIPKEGAAVLSGNHSHALDPILVDISTKRTVHALGKKDLHDGPFGFLFRGVGTIPVDFSKSRNHDALATAQEMLREGILINVSPEGERNYSDELLLPFKYGAVAMALRTPCEIVPYAITGRYIPFFGRPSIRFGAPLKVGGMTIEAANEHLYNSIAALLKEQLTEEEYKAKIVHPYRGRKRAAENEEQTEQEGN